MTEKAGFLGLGTAGGVVAAGCVVAMGVGALYWTGALSPDAPVAPVPVVAVQTPQPAPTEAETPGPGDANIAVATPEPEEEAARVAGSDADAPDTDAAETDTAPAESVAEAPDPDPAAQAVSAPRFDVVRAAPDGTTIVAGQGAPGSVVTVLLDGQVADSQTVSEGGEFVSLLTLPASTAPRLLSLIARQGDRETPSVEEIILAPTPAPRVAQAPADQGGVEEDVAVAQSAPPATEPSPDDPDVAPPTATEPEPGIESSAVERDTGGALPVEPLAEAAPAPQAQTDPQEDADSQTPETQVAPDRDSGTAESQVATGEAAPQVQTTEIKEPRLPTAPAQDTAVPAPSTAVAVLRADEAGVELLQPASPDAAPSQDQIVLDTIGYAPQGAVLLSGRSAPAGLVRIYLDNLLQTDLRAGEDGRWRARLEGIAPGVYTLRLDALDEDGRVLSRLETPFKRESPAALAAAQAQAQAAPPAPPVSQVTVQAGDTLWAISRERYGDGLLFVRVFEANRDAIRDPDLIFPGQVFAIPE